MSRDVCFYDGRCGLCRRTTRLIRALDWIHRLEFRDLTTAPDLPVDMSAALAGMPMRTRDAKVLVGFPAVRRALRQTPLGFAPALALSLPGIAHLAAAAYDRVARHRRRTCTIGPLPAPAPRGDSPAP